MNAKNVLFSIFLLIFLASCVSATPTISYRNEDWGDPDTGERVYLNFTCDEAHTERHVLINGVSSYNSSGSWSAHGSNYIYMGSDTLDKPGRYYNLTLYVVGPTGTSNYLEWHYITSRQMATVANDTLESFTTVDYDNLVENISEGNVTGTANTIVKPFTNVMDKWFFVVFFVAMFVVTWQKTGSLSVFSVLLLIIGVAIMGFVPSMYWEYGMYALIAGMAYNLWALARQRG